MSAALMALIPFLRSYGFVFAPTISADTSNYNLRAAAVAAGWDQVAPLFATVTLNSGIVISASSTANYAFDTGVTFPSGSVLALVSNGGYIIGMGGKGGSNSAYGATAGAAGGPALRAQFALTVTNTGTIAGGGGGGGAAYANDPYGSIWAGGGGGRSGRTNSSGGADGYRPGGAGTFTSAGAGGSGSTYYGYTANGGAGGGWGAAGANGSGASGSYAGGAGGACTVGNANIDWVSTGTRYGSLT